MGGPRRNFHHRPPRVNRFGSPETRTLQPPPAVERQAPVIYGKPFILLEDAEKKTFIFKGGAWVEHFASIAECRATCQVKELPQRVNKMVRYEVRSPE